jgi:glucose/arabinose dehydrogenase
MRERRLANLAANYLLPLAAMAITLPGGAMAQTTFADDYVPQPAYASQTRAPLANQSPRLTVTTVVSGLTKPWSIEFLPSGNMLVTELPGRIRIVDAEGNLSEPVQGLPPIRAYQSNGLHGTALDPDFENNRLIYFTYLAPFDGETGGGTDEEYAEWTEKANAAGRGGPPLGVRYVARARLSADERRLENLQVLLQAPGKRLVFSADGKLMITTVMGGGSPDTPQHMDEPFGKVMRINPDGSIPADNPWVNDEGTLPEIYAAGFRDPQGAALNPWTKELWVVENGPRGGDELNVIRSGRNYGWPIITYGRNYNKSPVGDGITSMDGMEQPIYFWAPSIAPSDMTFYTGDMFPQWKGNLLVTAMAGEHLARLVLVGDRVVGEERLFVGFGDRLREVREGPDGAVWLLTDSVDNGRLVRLSRR